MKARCSMVETEIACALQRTSLGMQSILASMPASSDEKQRPSVFRRLFNIAQESRQRRDPCIPLEEQL